LLVTVLGGLAVLVLSAVPAAALPAGQKAPTIDFERDTNGAKPDGFASLDLSIAHFSNSVSLLQSSPEFDGRGVAGFSAGPEPLVIRFDVPVRQVTLPFGNDDPSFTQDGDRARLNAFRGQTLVDSNSVVMNRDDVLNQVVAVSGSRFNRVEFLFVRAGAAVPGLAEALDNIQITVRCTIKGTNGKDRQSGTDGRDALCGFGGRDRQAGKAGNDALFGGAGNDKIKAGPGNDTAVGGQGNDVIRAIDGIDGNDTVYGGPGADTCFVDAGDATKGCEDIRLPV
jgi:Ca2+-binding RTX toxin-like protein